MRHLPKPDDFPRPYKHSQVVLELFHGGWSKIRIMRYLMNDLGCNWWVANREVFVFLKKFEAAP